MMGEGPPSPDVAPFSGPLALLPVLAPTRSDATTDYYENAMREEQVQILPGRPTTICGFNGQFPGPTIRARQGREAVVRFVNNLSGAMPAIHLHGGHVPPESDGYPTDVIAPGSYRDYRYPNRQLGATLSYHDHEMGHTGRNVYMGLFGTYLLDDGYEAQAGLNLPRGDSDVVLIIQDRRFNADGSFNYAMGACAATQLATA